RDSLCEWRQGMVASRAAEHAGPRSRPATGTARGTVRGLKAGLSADGWAIDWVHGYPDPRTLAVRLPWLADVGAGARSGRTRVAPHRRGHAGPVRDRGRIAALADARRARNRDLRTGNDPRLRRFPRGAVHPAVHAAGRAGAG